MIKTIDFSEFCDSFRSYKENFSYNGKRALFDYLENLESDIGEPIKLDPIALCCNYTEYDSALDCAKALGYEEGIDLEPHGSVDLVEVSALEEKQAHEWLGYRTNVIDVEGGGVIINNF